MWRRKVERMGLKRVRIHINGGVMRWMVGRVAVTRGSRDQYNIHDTVCEEGWWDALGWWRKK